MDKPSPSRRSRSRKRCFLFVSPVFLLFVVGLFLAVFWNVLLGNQQFVYRDESHFYYPVFQYIQAELKMGRFPLWTPYESIGQPFFANAALGILYPGKLIFFLPLDYSILYNLYITGHVFLAALTLYRLARYWQIGVWGATLGALSYGFAGTVLGQYCNPIFLVGAAWVPEAVLWADRMLVRRRLRYAFVFSAILSIMLLGGDPQAAFHVGMAASLLALFRWFREHRLLRSSGPALAVPANKSLLRHLLPEKLIRNRVALLGVVVVSTFLLSAVQILPSQEYSRLCNRAGYKNPRTIWEIPRFLMADEKDIDDLTKEEILFDDSSVRTRQSADIARLTRWQRIYNGIFHEGKIDPHQFTSYNFSEHPIQFLEFLWSRIEGLHFPRNSTWFSGVVTFQSAANWFSTLYMGVVPVLLAVVSFRFRFIGKNVNIRIVWLTWFLLIALWSGMGIYGLGWFLESLGIPTTFSGLTIHRAVGGGYWFLQTFVPGYIQFRYSAKLLTLAAFPIAVLAAYGFDRLLAVFQGADVGERMPEIRDRSIRWFCRLSVVLIAVSLLFLLPALMQEQWIGLAQTITAGENNGPFVPELAQYHACRSLAQTAFILFGTLLAIRWRGRFSTTTLATIVLFLVSADLYISCKNIVFVADRSYYLRDESVVWSRIRDESQLEPTRIAHRLKHLVRWYQESSPERLIDFLTRNRQQLESQCLYMLPHDKSGNLPIARVDEAGTLIPYSYAQWIVRNLRDDYRFETNLMMLGTRFALMDVSRPLDPKLATPVMQYGRPDTPENWPENLALWELKMPRNRVWIEGENRNPDKPDPEEPVRIVRYEPSTIVIEAELRRPGTVVLSDQYWPGWQLDVETLTQLGGETVSRQPGTIQPILRIFRGTDLEPGIYRLTYRYAPDSFRNGAILSVTGWSLLAVFLVVMALRKRRTKNRGYNATELSG